MTLRPALLLALVCVACAGEPELPGESSQVVSVEGALAPTWTGTWAVSPQSSGTTFSGQTLRQIVHTSIAGTAARIQLSNVFGNQSVQFSDVHVAQRTSGSSISTSSDRVVTFGGQSSVTVPAGGLAVSDSIAFAVTALSDVAVSFYLPQGTGPATSHGQGSQTNYIASGDVSGNATVSGSTTGSYYFLMNLDVQNSSSNGAVVTLGASITDGFASSGDANKRWPNDLAVRLVNAGAVVGVLNQGINGNRLLADSGGQSAPNRFDRDVLAQPGVAWVIFSDDPINDLGSSNPPTGSQLITAISGLITRAHTAGIKFLCSTLTPFQGSGGWTTTGETGREQINAFVRGAGSGCDGVVDQDAATHDPANPTKFLPAYDSGDHLHPNDAGLQAIANAVNLTFFGVAPPAEGPFGGTPAAVPGTVQAENYDTGGQGVAYSINSVNGTANGYRTDGVDLENTADAGGGLDIGWTSGGQWFRYTVSVATAGPYTVSFRLASATAVGTNAGTLHLQNAAGASLTGTITAPGTGGWQNWTTVTATATLPAGRQVLTIFQDGGGYNINYLTFAAASSGEAPFGGTPAAVPGMVQAENYDTGGQGVAYSINSVNGTANGYRTDGVDLENTADTGGGLNVGWTSGGQWFRYTVNVATAGSYTVSFRLASATAVGMNAGTLHLQNAAGASLTGAITAPGTGGWQNWTTVTATATLPAGQQVLTIFQDSGGYNINYLTFTTASSGEAPFGGTPAAIPGTIQFENYDVGGEGVAYHDNDGVNSGGQYRNDGVDIEICGDSGGGFDVGWTSTGQWLRYTVNVMAAGTRTVSFRVAAAAAVGATAGQFHIQTPSGTNLSGTINVPGTGGWQTYTNVTASITLPAGEQILELFEETGGYNLNYMTF
jgi:lysophospholipase L1-like esterase